MPGLLESVESQRQASPSFHEPLWKSRQPARFPHSHSADDEVGGKVENQKQVFHIPTAPIPLSQKQKNKACVERKQNSDPQMHLKERLAEP